VNNREIKENLIMAKIAFSKFGLKPNSEVKTINWGG
jgi:hypothetical protein